MEETFWESAVGKLKWLYCAAEHCGVCQTQVVILFCAKYTAREIKQIITRLLGRV